MKRIVVNTMTISDHIINKRITNNRKFEKSTKKAPLFTFKIEQKEQFEIKAILKQSSQPCSHNYRIFLNATNAENAALFH